MAGVADRLSAGFGRRTRRAAIARYRRRRDLRLGRGPDLGGPAAEARRPGRAGAPARQRRRWPRYAVARARGDSPQRRGISSPAGGPCRLERTRSPQFRSEKHPQSRPDDARVRDMKTEFSPAQLANPDIAEADKILRACVHCGFCTATCPTYVLLGDELDSPRGRIYLIKEMLEKGGPEGAKTIGTETVKHIDRCLSCLACMTTCPSGVHYMHLVDHGRRHIEEHYRRPWAERLLRRLLGSVLTRPGLMRV